MDLRCHLAALLTLCVAATATSAEPPSAAELAARIDEHLARAWAEANVEPIPPADDQVFLRRVSLDLIGRIPTVAESREFLNDSSPDKRARLIDRLLASGAFARHWAVFSRRSWIPQTDTQQFARLAGDFEAWFAGRLRDNARYDRLVEELLTVPTARSVPALAARSETTASAPKTFLEAGESRPENLAANASRAFLGINLDCAQCHNHPFSRWTRDEFWETAAFFAQPKAGDDAMPQVSLTIPDTTQTVTPKLLDGQTPQWPERAEAETGRKLLARWIIARDNPYFARNAVNRIWANVFGTGLIEPLDDLSDENPASHPELLAELSGALTASGFDLRLLTKAMLLSRAYQSSCVAPGSDGVSRDPSLFASSQIRGLTGEQLYDSLRVAAGLPVEREDVGVRLGLDARQDFIGRFRVERASRAQRSIIQALALMNGRLTFELTSPESPTLTAVANAPFFDESGKVEALFLAALGRQPGDEEAGPLAAYVKHGGLDGDPRKALADVFWSLINSSEFNTNH